MSAKRRVYTKENDDFIREHVPKKGIAWTARRMKINPSLLSDHCRVIGVRFGVLEGRISAAELSKKSKIPKRVILRAAKAANRLYRYGSETKNGGNGVRMMVCDGWAAKFIDEYTQTLDFEKAYNLGTKEVVELLNVDTDTVTRACAGKGMLADHFKRVRFARGYRNRWRFNGGDVLSLQMKLKAERKELVPMKTIVVDSEYSRSQARVKLHKEAGVRPVYKLRAGKVEAFFPKEAVKEVFGV